MATAPMALDRHTILAVSKAVKPKQLEEARAAVQPGSTELSLLVSLKGSLIVNFDKPAGVASDKPGAFDPWLLLHLAIERPGLSVRALSQRAAAAKPSDVAQAAAVKAQFEVNGAELLPKVVVAAAAGSRGAVSFSGVMERKA